MGFSLFSACAVFLLLGIVHANRGWLNSESDSDGDLDQFVNTQDGMNIEEGNDVDHRPHPHPHPRPPPPPPPHPHRPSFFVGSFISKPKRDWQINMWQIFTTYDLPAEYVNMVMNITISDQKNGTFQYTESVGNDTLWSSPFQLNKPVNDSDGQYIFRARGKNLLTILGNSTLGLNRVDMQFDQGGGVNVVYRLISQNVTGARHFRRVRKNSNNPFGSDLDQDIDQEDQPDLEGDDQQYQQEVILILPDNMGDSSSGITLE